MSLRRRDLLRQGLIDPLRLIDEPGANTCLYFAMQAAATWEDIGFVREFKRRKQLAGRKGLPVTEESITEVILRNFHRLSTLALANPLNRIELYEAEREPREGNDLDLAITYDWGTVRFSVQAKLLSKDGAYVMIGHQNRTTKAYQIDLLLAASAVKGTIPLYLFYNHWPLASGLLTRICGQHIDALQYGCTIADAIRIRQTFFGSPPAAGMQDTRRWRIPEFEELHEHVTPASLCGTPWLSLFCCEHQDLAALCKAISVVMPAQTSTTVVVPRDPPDRLRAEGYDLTKESATPILYKRVVPVSETALKVEVPLGEAGVYYPKYLLTIDRRSN